MLHDISSPDDIKKYSFSELNLLCKEIREFLIDHASKNGGHFASSLGVVELTVALHYVFDMKNNDDSIIWDVGHQSYVHKLLTERKEKFSTMRKKGGISPFPKPSESKYDSFIGGHASISISAGLGIDIANKKQKKRGQTVVVIGDGALTGGQTFEALNNAGDLDTDILIIFNDNQMSIDSNVGGLQKMFQKNLLKITTSRKINTVKQNTKNILNNIFGEKISEKISGKISKFKQILKNRIYIDNNYFKSLHLNYFGPYNGHDLENLIFTLRKLKKQSGPKILHIFTKKGKGFHRAEKNQTKYHSTSGFSLDEENEKLFSHQNKKKFQEFFGETLLEIMSENPLAVGVTPAMPTGCSMTIPQKKFPERIFDVGITEPHAVTFSAGMASKGMIVFCNIYSSFVQRAVDQIIHDCAIEKIPVIFCFDRAGLVGEDGETHQGVFDIALFSSIPNITILTPRSGKELRNIMKKCVKLIETKKVSGPIIIRYPKGNAEFPSLPLKERCGDGYFPPKKIFSGEAKIFDKTVILSTGPLCYSALKNPEISMYDIYDVPQIKPLPKKFLENIFKTYKRIITLEEGVKSGGFGSKVLEFANIQNFKGEIILKGVPEKFISHARREEQLEECNLNSDKIIL